MNAREMTRTNTHLEQKALNYANPGVNSCGGDLCSSSERGDLSASWPFGHVG